MNEKPPSNSVTCPTCGRPVEIGFRFCDGCGGRLDTATSGEKTTSPEVPPLAMDEVEPLLDRWRRRRIDRRARRREDRRPQPDHWLENWTKVPERVPLLERWRRRRREANKGHTEELASPPRLEDVAESIEPPAPPSRVGGAFSRPKPAEELRGVPPVIGGRLQWSAPEGIESSASPETEAPLVWAEADASTVADAETATLPSEPEAPPLWRPVPTGEPDVERAAARPQIVRFAAHLVVSFFSGAFVLFAITAIASVASDGNVAVLEARGLPIFVGGVVSIVVFALFRTSGRGQLDPSKSRTRVVLSVFGGFVVLVVLAAVLYRPAVASRVQPRLERVLQVFSAADEAAVRALEDDILEWNQQAGDLRSLLEQSLTSNAQPDQVRATAASAESSLENVVAHMDAHAASAQQPRLKDALSDMVSIYKDELGGLRLVDRGVLIDEIQFVRDGEARLKNAQARAAALFNDRLRGLIERAGLKADSFGQAVAA